MEGTDATERARAGESDPERAVGRAGGHVDTASGERPRVPRRRGQPAGPSADRDGEPMGEPTGEAATEPVQAPAGERPRARAAGPAHGRPRARAAGPAHAPLADPVQHRLVEQIQGHVLEPLHDRLVNPIHGRIVAPFHEDIVDPIESHLVEPLHERLVAPVAGAVGQVFAVAGGAWSRRRGVSGRRLAARARAPLANLYELYPEARTANPRELGLRFVPLEEIRGTAVAGAAQRGGDFLPLKPFRGDNWRGRWARIKAANERLQSLPPVDLVKYDGAFWVMDGHNRVAAALYAGGVGLDAVVTELIPLGASSSERPASFAPLMGESAAFRAAVQGRRPAFGVELAGQPTPDEREEAEREADERPATATEDRPTPQPGERGGESERGNAGPGSASLDRPGASA